MKGGIRKLGQSTVTRYVLRRLLALIPVLLGVTFITYGLMYISPKDPVEMMLQASGTAPSQEVVDAMREHGAVYFAAVGGAAALMARCVTACEVIAWDDLGPESVKRLTLRDLPLIVAIDAAGENAFEKGQAAYLRALSGQ